MSKLKEESELVGSVTTRKGETYQVYMTGDAKKDFTDLPKDKQDKLVEEVLRMFKKRFDEEGW